MSVAPLRIMFISGEPSGDALGAELLTSLNEQSPRPITAFGAGGPKLRAAGLRLDLDLTVHAVVGIWEVLKNYGKFKRFFDDLINTAIREKPDAVILIDYPGFNLRFAKKLRALTGADPSRPQIIYYVSPQLWAWHESRVHEIARNIDLMLAIFPFEQAWYRERVPKFKVEFVGHPMFDRYAKTAPATKSLPRPLLTLLPGSRVRELRKHLPVMIPAADAVRRATGSDVRLVVPSESLRRMAEDAIREYGDGLSASNITVGNLAETLTQTDVAIAASGTVTMECAYFKVPTVVLYRTSWSTYFLGKRFIKTKFLAMPNVLAGNAIYPEFIQDAATPENLARAAVDFLNNSERRSVVKSQLDEVLASLGGVGASKRAADLALSAIASR